MKKPAQDSWTTIVASALLSFAALSTGCGDGGGGESDDPVKDTTPRKPGAMTEKWRHSVIVDADAGLHLRLRYDETAQHPVLAYYETLGMNAGPCGGSDAVPNRTEWNLVYMEEGTAGWRSETVAQTLSQSAPRGFDLRLSRDGTPAIAAITGDLIDMPPNYYCGANDLGYFERTAPGRWSEVVTVETSGEAASGEPASDAGIVVGYWPALAFDAGGSPAIAYRDVHFGGIQNDDFERADLELARGGGGWGTEPVEVGVGAGQYTTLHFDDAGRPLIVHYNPVMQELDNRTGLWVMRSEDDGQTWQQVRLFSAPLINPMSAAFDADGRPVIAYYDPGRGLPVLATLTDEAQFESAADGWSLETIGDSRYDEGYDPSIAFDDDGGLALSYYRCTRTDDSLGSCSAEDDALVFGYRGPDDSDFAYETVDGGEDIGECGRSTQLVFEGPGKPAIAYTCNGRDGDTLLEQIRYARRDTL